VRPVRYLFSGEWQDVPAVSAHEGCRRIAIEFTIPVQRIPPRDLRIIAPSWRKILSFVLAEGPLTTFRKVRSKRAALSLASDFHVVFGLGRDIDRKPSPPRGSAEQTYLCLGTRHPACAEIMLFLDDLTVALEVAPAKKSVAAAVTQTLESGNWEMESIGGYNLFSGLLPPASARELLDTAASVLTASPTPAYQHKHLQEPLEPPRPLAVPQSANRKGRSGHGVSLVAAGDYARTDIVPALRRAGCVLRAVADIEPHVAAYTQRVFGFEAAVTDWRDALQHPGTDTVVVASFHDSHATIAAEALRQGKNVLLEKPPVVTTDDLDILLDAARTQGFLDIGYNRRYAPFARQAKALVTDAKGPMTMTMLVREVEIPPQHWYRWPKEGTRVTGNLCHWLDLAIFLLDVGPVPQEMTVSAPADPEHDEERTFTVVFDEGSTVTIVATQRGDPTLGVQELIDIRRDDISIRIDDFRRFDATRMGRTLSRARSRRDKGHRAMYDEMLRRVRNAESPLYTLRDLEVTSRLTILATDMVRTEARRMLFPA
jgi:predicted dehydrogenase